LNNIIIILLFILVINLIIIVVRKNYKLKKEINNIRIHIKEITKDVTNLVSLNMKYRELLNKDKKIKEPVNIKGIKNIDPNRSKQLEEIEKRDIKK